MASGVGETAGTAKPASDGQHSPTGQIMTVPRPISVLVAEVLGENAIWQARDGLSVALGVLQGIAVRRPRVKVMYEMLSRLKDAAGITGVVPFELENVGKTE
ncbi:hypothetical protein HDU96_001001 [Phlyctochytrium bullatum]|nr:hypothetical protein HDU96_001001 [Phlyctochytrium bullatum]